MVPMYPPFITAMKDADPLLYPIITENYDLSMGSGELDQKTKLLIALAVDAYAGSTGVQGIAGRARQCGATEQEIAEALRISYCIAGNRVLASSAPAFKS